jgi:hypothetical protein
MSLRERRSWEWSAWWVEGQDVRDKRGRATMPGKEGSVGQCRRHSKWTVLVYDICFVERTQRAQLRVAE